FLGGRGVAAADRFLDLAHESADATQAVAIDLVAPLVAADALLGLGCIRHRSSLKNPASQKAAKYETAAPPAQPANVGWLIPSLRLPVNSGTWHRNGYCCLQPAPVRVHDLHARKASPVTSMA